jgi:osmotically-inducible protein OsmY
MLGWRDQRDDEIMNGLARAGFGLALIGLSALGGCGPYAASEKCGFAGCPGDAAITAEVRRLFAEHPALGPPNLIDAQAIDHVVYLTGLLDTDVERQLAESTAREAKGVTRVVDSIGLSSNR